MESDRLRESLPKVNCNIFTLPCQNTGNLCGAIRDVIYGTCWEEGLLNSQVVNFAAQLTFRLSRGIGQTAYGDESITEWIYI